VTLAISADVDSDSSAIVVVVAVVIAGDVRVDEEAGDIVVSSAFLVIVGGLEQHDRMAPTREGQQ